MSLFSFMFFFFKQKTAYEMRISDWSSDVCSSDLLSLRGASANCRQALSMKLSFGPCCAEACALDRSGCFHRPAAGEALHRFAEHPKRLAPGRTRQIGRAACRERGCQCV